MWYFGRAAWRKSARQYIGPGNDSQRAERQRIRGRSRRHWCGKWGPGYSLCGSAAIGYRANRWAWRRYHRQPAGASISILLRSDAGPR